MSNYKVIALTNQKGGVDKTSTAVNLDVSLAQQDVIDDNPREASEMFHYDENEDAGNVGKPYSIEVCDTPRRRNLYVVANEDVYFSYGM